MTSSLSRLALLGLAAAVVGAEPRLIVVDTADRVGGIDATRLQLKVTEELARELTTSAHPFGLPDFVLEAGDAVRLESGPRPDPLALASALRAGGSVDWRLSQRSDDPAYRAAFFASSVAAAFAAGSGPRILWTLTPSEQEQRAAALLASFAEASTQVAATGGDEVGFAVLAGVARDGQSLRILIANFAREPADGLEYRDNEGYLVRIDGVPWGAAAFRTEIWGLHGDDAARRGWGRGGRFRLRRSMPPPSVEMIVLRREDAPLSEMVPRRRSR